MRKMNSFVCCFMVLLAMSFSSAWAKKAKDDHTVSGIYLDVLRIDACAEKKGCVAASGPMQLNLLDLADGKVNFASKVLLPARTKELRLVLGDNNTIAVDDESYPLDVPSGKSSGLKLKGQRVFGKEGGLLSGLTLNLNLKKQLVIHAKKVKAKGHGKGNKNPVEEVLYSFKLKPVVAVKTAEVAPLTDEVAAVLAAPDKENEITLGDNFSLVIPAGAVPEPMVISVKETKYTVEVMDEATGEVVEKPALSSMYELNPDGAEFAVPLKITIPYNPDTLPSDVSEDNLAVYLDGEKIPTALDTTSKLAAADVWHFSVAKLSDGSIAFQTQMPIGDKFEPHNMGWKFMTKTNTDIFHPGTDLNATDDKSIDIPVYAIADGTIVANSPNWGGIVIKHTLNDKMYYSQYGHIKHVTKKEEEMLQSGMEVKKGTKIGYIGKVGNAESEHLHFEIRNNFHPNSEYADCYWPSNTRNDCNILKTRKEVFKAYESPLAFVRSYENPYQLTIIVEDSVTYPGLGESSDDNKIENNKVVDSEGNVIKERFFKPYPSSFSDPDDLKKNLLEWSTGTSGEGCDAEKISCQQNSGFGGNYHYAETVLGPKETSAGKWFFDLPEGGYYSVYASIPIGAANTKNAKYQISHNGRIDYKTVNQDEIEGPLENRWVRLGTYDFAKGNNHYVKLANNTGEAGKDIAFDAIKLVKVYSNLPTVYSVSPATTIKDSKTIFTVTGQNLRSDLELEFFLDNCDRITELGGSATLREFECTPNNIGQYSGAVKAGESLLKEFSVKVTDPPVPTLQKITVQPKSESDNILYEGEQACYEAVGTFSDGTESVITDRCTWLTSQYATSLGNGLVEALPESAGNEVRITAVYSDGTIDIGGTHETLVTKRPVIVHSISPTSVTLGVKTDFTVMGQNMPSTLTFQLEGCAEVKQLDSNTSSTYKQFRCTPSSPLGDKSGYLIDSSNGTVLKTFSVNFIDPLPPSDDIILLAGVKVFDEIDSQVLKEGNTADYIAKACLFKHDDVDDLDTLLDEATTYTSEACFDDQEKNIIMDVTEKGTWLVTPTMYAISLGNGLVQAKSGAAGQEVKVKCTYYHSPSNRNFTGTLPVTIR